MITVLLFLSFVFTAIINLLLSDNLCNLYCECPEYKLISIVFLSLH